MSFAKLRTPDGIELCYEILGQENSGVPIVLMHGAGLQMLTWPDGFFEMLVQGGRRVIRYDHRDSGESSDLKHLPAPSVGLVALKLKLGIKISPPYTLEDMAVDLVHLLDGLRIEKAHLVGVSLGSMIAQVTAINHPDKVASLTCIATQARNSRLAMPKLVTVLKIMRRPKPGREGYIKWNLNLVHAVGGAAAEGPDDYLRDIAERMYDRGVNDPGMARQVTAVYASPDRRPALAKLNLPALVIHGAEDPLISPEAGREVAEAIPGARFELIQGLGHGILQPAWQRMAGLIAEHVEGAEARVSTA
jgi:pimeloyl-ACP methyl ester carboxylesterase